MATVLWILPGFNRFAINAFLWLAPLPERGFPTPDGGHRLLILSPHPDDEALAAGGTIVRWLREGGSVLVVFLTNGDANVAGKRLLSLNPFPRASDYCALGLRRQKEASLALRRLGVPPGDALFLGYPDRGLLKLWEGDWTPEHPYRSPYTKASSPGIYPTSYHPGDRYCRDDLLRDLREIVVRYRPEVVYLPGPWDRHPDHRATYLFGLRALRDVGYRGEIRLYLVHYPHWPRPQRLVPGLSLSPPAALADLPWVELSLSEEEEGAKLRALKAYSSQWWTDGHFLGAFVRRDELFFHWGPTG